MSLTGHATIPALAVHGQHGGRKAQINSSTRYSSFDVLGRMTARMQTTDGRGYAFIYALSSEGRGALRGVADFDGHLLAENRERGLDLLGLRSMLGVEHAADHALVESQAAGQTRSC